MQNYNFVIFQKHFDYYRIAYSDIIKRSDAKFVCFYQDLVDKHPRAEPDKLRQLFDLMLSYDKGDVEKYGLTYIDRMSYSENLKHVVRSKCLLEIIQSNAKGATVRTWEAIMYDKKLLTNNYSVVDDFYYNDSYISLLGENGIDAELLKQDNHFINPYKNEIGPNSLLEFISSSFTEERIYIQNN